MSRELSVSWTQLSQYHFLFCAPEAVILVEKWRKLLSDSQLHSKIVAVAVNETY